MVFPANLLTATEDSQTKNNDNQEQYK